jgi:Na+-driven multidrug efflux pump
MAAQYWGKKDLRTIEKILGLGMRAAVFVTALFFLAAQIMPEQLLRIFTSEPEVIKEGVKYLRIVSFSYIFMGITQTYLYIMRSVERVVVATVVYLCSLLCNITINAILIFGLLGMPAMGVQGAAVATVIAQGISVVLCILYVMRRVPLLLPARKHWAVGQHLYWELFSQSISMGLMSSIVSAGSVVLQYGINGLGTLTIAGHTAARKLFSFTSMPLISMANAGSTFVSQNRGAAQPERVRKGMRTMYLCSVVIMAAEVVLMQLFARQLVQLISGSSAPLVLENGARYLMWNAPFYAVLGVLLCTRYALQSLGQKVLPLFSSVIELVGKVIFVLVFIPRYAYNAVILCEPIIWCFMAAYLVAVYRRDAFVYPRKKTI